MCSKPLSPRSSLSGGILWRQRWTLGSSSSCFIARIALWRHAAPYSLEEPNKILLSCTSTSSKCTSSGLPTRTGNVIARVAQVVARTPLVSFAVTCQELWHSFFAARWHLLAPKLLPSRSCLEPASHQVSSSFQSAGVTC